MILAFNETHKHYELECGECGETYIADHPAEVHFDCEVEDDDELIHEFSLFKSCPNCEATTTTVNSDGTCRYCEYWPKGKP
jgi:hypothetical protein